MLKQEKGDRTDARNIIVMISDGRLHDPNEYQQKATQLINEGYQVILIEAGLTSNQV